MYKNNFTIESVDAGNRLDKFLESKLEINRSQIKKYIKSESILVNGKNVKAGYSLKEKDKISVAYEDEFKLLPEDIDFKIIYEDEYLAIISKPQNLVVHPGAGNKNGTLVNGLLNKFENLSNPIDEQRPGIVHRLDKDTSGLMIIAKKDVKSVLVRKNSAKSLDPASMTSNMLSKVLGLNGSVVIGDRALKCYLDEGFDKFYDMGKIWHEKTNLPFVFAVFCLINSKKAYENLVNSFLVSIKWGSFYMDFIHLNRLL